MKTFSFAVILALGLLSAFPAYAQTLIHRYSFNGNANDSVGTANGTVVGGVTITPEPNVNGSAIFPGGTSSASPAYISLPVSAVSSLQNATIEIFTTNFTIPNTTGGVGGPFQALFSVGTVYGDTTNYSILSANRGSGGLGTGARINKVTETVISAHDDLPTGQGNHIVDLVFSSFTGVGSTGTETIYLDGIQVAQGTTTLSYADIAASASGITVVGIGGGSPWNDPTYVGAINEVRIYDGALTQEQLQTEVAAGPAAFGYQPGLQLITPAVSAVSETGGTVSWGTNNAADATVNYGTTTAYGVTATGPSRLFSHSVALSGLAAGTTYHYQIVSKDIYGQTQTSADATFTTVSSSNPLPAITALSPPAAAIGTSAFTLTVNGAGFVSSSAIKWNGTALTTTFVSATQLTAPIAASAVAAAGTNVVTVSTPAPGGGVSNAAGFKVIPPVGPAHVLWNKSDLTASLWTLKPYGVFTSRGYGPFAGWTAKAIAGGTDSTTRVLWTNTNGQMALWNVTDATGVYSSHTFGPFTGLTARAISVASDNTTHVLLTNANGQTNIWNYSITNGTYTSKSYGPYAGWTATGLADGADGKTRVLWINTNGQMSVWSLNNATGVFSSHTFGPYSGWTARTLSVASDNTTHILWTNASGQTNIWNYSITNGTYTSKSYGPYAGWTAKSIAEGTDGKMRVMWTDTSNALSVWSLNNATGVFSSYPYGSFTGWTAVGIATP